MDPSGHFDYSYDHIIYKLNVEEFVVEIHHGDFLYFPIPLVNSKKQQKAAFTQYTVVLEREKLNFGLRACRIFSCENIIIILQLWLALTAR